MRARAVVAQALASLRAAWGRSVLALLGITVGIGAVIAMISMGEIVARESLAQFRELGTDVVTLTRKGGGRAGRGPQIAVEDVVALAPHLASVSAAATWTDGTDEVRYAGRALGARPVVGITEGYARIGRLRAASGRLVSDLDGHRPYCVVGSEVAQAMRSAGAREVTGSEVRVLGRVLEVVGVLEPMGTRDFLGLGRPNAAVYLPIGTMRRLAETGPVQRVVLRAAAGVEPERAARETAALLGEWAGGPIEFRVRSARALIARMREQTRLFTVLLGAVGGISLVVGGAGVMNLMLISVGERRGEIGLRRAVGARKKDIRRQFVSESVVLCLAGGVLGIGLGAGSAYAICAVTGLPYALSGTSVALGVATSSVIGVVFGLYPAQRAASLDPVAALRG